MEPLPAITRKNYKEDLANIQILSFESEGKAVLFAGFRRGHFSNWDDAKFYADKHEMKPIHETEGGKHLNTPKNEREKIYHPEQLRRVWNRASVKYCLKIEGSVRTFVCGANPKSTFRRKEIQTLLRQRGTKDINGRDLSDYVALRRRALQRLTEEGKLSPQERHHRSITKVFRAIAIQEVRQQLKEAGNDNDAKNAAIKRITFLRFQHLNELGLSKDFSTSSGRSTDIVEEEILPANPHLAHLVAHNAAALARAPRLHP